MSLLVSLLSSDSGGGGGGGTPLGNWNAATNTPTLPNPPTSADYSVGDYYTVIVAGTQFGFDFTVDDRIVVIPNGLDLQWNKETGGAVDSIIGTTNQIIVSNPTGEVTLSLPQNINIAASPTFAGLNLSGLTIDRVAITDGSKNIVSAGVTTTQLNYLNTGFANTALKVFDTDASHVLSIVPGSNLSADRALTLTTGDAARTITLSGNPTLSDWFDQSVKAAASPSFSSITAVGDINMTGTGIINLAHAPNTSTATTLGFLSSNVLLIKGEDGVNNTAPTFLLRNTSKTGAGLQYLWQNAGTTINRDSNGLVLLDGSFNIRMKFDDAGGTLTQMNVVATTGTVGSPDTTSCSSPDFSRRFITNEGVSAKAYVTLGSAATGGDFIFYCQDADGIRITAASGDTIRLGSSVTAAAGFIESTTPGSLVRISAINSTEWVAREIQGSWSSIFLGYDIGDVLVTSITLSGGGAFVKNNTVNTFTKAQSVTPVAVTSSSNHIATDSSLSNIFTHTMTENTTLDNPTNLVSGTYYTWRFIQHASAAKTLALGNLFVPMGSAYTITTTLSANSVLTALYDGTSLLYTTAQA